MAVSWDKKFETGNQQIDYQHQRLFDLINQVSEVCESGECDRDALNRVLDGLQEYTVTHFYQEEILMEERLYPDLEAHRAQHTAFTDKIVEMRKIINGTSVKEENMKNVLNLREFLTTWLSAHILKVDHEYVPYLKKDQREHG